MPKYTEVFKELGIQQKQVAEVCRIDEPTISKIVKGSILPNRAKLERLCKQTGKNPLDFYEKHEINLLAVCKSKCKSIEFKRFYKITGRLPREICGVLLDEEKMQICGYDSKMHWIRACVGRLNKQYEIIQKAKEKKK